MTESEEKFVDIEQAMARLSLSRAEVYRRVVDGVFKADGAERRLRFTEAEVERYAQVLAGERENLAGETVRWLSFFAARLDQYEDVTLQEVADKPVADQVAELGERILLDGVLSRVRDLYLDPLREGYRLLYGFQGNRQEVARFAPTLCDRLRDWFKGRVTLPAEGKVRQGLGQQAHGDQVHPFRLTAIPTLLGEHVHLNFFPHYDRGGIAGLGYFPAQEEALRRLLDGRPGLLLLAGPAAPEAEEHRLGLALELSAAGRLVVSLEHRVHFHSELLVQLDLGEEAEFDAVWRTALDMGPDVLLVDEVCTAEEAKKLLEGVAGGMAVVAQVRAPSGLDCLRQLLGFEVERQTLARQLLGLIEWTRLRQLCPHCRTHRSLEPEETQRLRVANGRQVAVAQGCAVCGDGFLGRRSVYGLWTMEPGLFDWIRTPDASPELLVRNLSGELSLSQAVRQAVVTGEVEWEEAASFLQEEQVENGS